METVKQNYERLQIIAADQNLTLNPDKERTDKVIGLMATNYDLVKEWICPCKQKNKPPIQGADITCPCPEWLDEIKQNGQCHCRLFIKCCHAAR